MTQERTSPKINKQSLLDIATDVTVKLIDLSDRLIVIEGKMDAIPHDRHNEEHEWLKMDIERRKAQRDFWIDIHKRLATSGILGATGLLLSALLYGFVQWLKNPG